MGRRAGISPEQTRTALLRAAARVFSRDGYDRATIAEIARGSGLSSGAIYAHYEGKADLFLAVLRAHVQHELEQLLEDDRPFDIGTVIAELGSNLDRRPAAERTLLVEAVMAAKHDDKTRAVLSEWFTERHEFIAAAIESAQALGTVTSRVSPAAAARFTSTVLLGSMLLDVLDVPSVDHDDWAGLITEMVNAFRVAADAPTSRA